MDETCNLNQILVEKQEEDLEKHDDIGNVQPNPIGLSHEKNNNSYEVCI